MTVSPNPNLFPNSLLRIDKLVAGVTKLVEVEADLSRIPVALIPKAKGADGKMYYKIDYQIQITYYSAYTTYELIHNKINYGLVSSEYV